MHHLAVSTAADRRPDRHVVTEYEALRVVAPNDCPVMWGNLPQLHTAGTTSRKRRCDGSGGTLTMRVLQHPG